MNILFKVTKTEEKEEGDPTNNMNKIKIKEIRSKEKKEGNVEVLLFFKIFMLKLEKIV